MAALLLRKPGELYFKLVRKLLNVRSSSRDRLSCPISCKRISATLQLPPAVQSDEQQGGAVREAYQDFTPPLGVAKNIDNLTNFLTSEAKRVQLPFLSVFTPSLHSKSAQGLSTSDLSFEGLSFSSKKALQKSYSNEASRCEENLLSRSDSKEALTGADTDMEQVKFIPKLASVDELPAVIPFTLDLSHRNKGALDQLEVRYSGEAWEDASVTASTSERHPEESWLEIKYPFTRSPSLREQYRLFGTRYVRFGKILEDMDAMAGDVVWRHIRRKDRLIATAAVDHLAWAGDLIQLDKDFRIQGQVTWVGRSSMEITLEASTQGPEPGDKPEVLGSAHFVMVSRDGDKGAPVPKLVLRTPQAKQLFEAGRQNAERRKQDREESLYRKAPTGDELGLLHELFIQTEVANSPEQEWTGTPKSESSDDSQKAIDADTWTFMENTKVQSVRLMHSQQRNANGFMFGGFVMREAFELGWICARLHTRLTPVIISVDDVAFMKPVPIGSLIQFTAQVIYVEGSLLRVLVQADELGPAAPHGGAERLHTTTNFHFAFSMVDRKMGSGLLGPFAAASVESPTSKGPHSSQSPLEQQVVRKVMPRTYAEGMRYLEGYRWHTWEAELGPSSRKQTIGITE